MLGPKLVPESFASEFLFTGATQQPSAGGKVTGPRPTLSLAVGRVCVLDMGHGKKSLLKPSGKEEQDLFIPLAHLRWCFSDFFKS